MIFERFFGRNKESAELERSREEERQKHKEAEQSMVKLSQSAKTLSPDQIVSEIENMHKSSGLALWPEQGMAFGRVLGVLESGNLHKEEVLRLLEALNWSEFEKFKDRDNAVRILNLARGVPSPQFVPVLQRHLERLETIKQQFKSQSEIGFSEAQQSMYAHEISGYTPIPFRADEARFQRGIEEEIRLTQAVIEACRK